MVNLWLTCGGGKSIALNYIYLSGGGQSARVSANVDVVASVRDRTCVRIASALHKGTVVPQDSNGASVRWRNRVTGK